MITSPQVIYEKTLIIKQDQELLTKTAHRIKDKKAVSFPIAGITEDVKVAEFIVGQYEWLVFWFQRGHTKYFQTFTRFLQSDPPDEWQEGEPAW